MPDSTDSSNSISVSKLLSDAIQSTLEAEKQGLMYYKDILSEFEAMDPISFRYFDDQGRALTINIPVLTLVPLSMLHIQEASFDFSVGHGHNGERTVHQSGFHFFRFCC
jgi:hypothetical protein